jgi:rfaE bifunctional protein kinase chain/domain
MTTHGITQSENRKTVFVFGDFDIVHPGHIRFLKFAAEQGDQLTVGIYDTEYSPNAFVPNEERIEVLKSFDFVSEVVVLSSYPLGYIREHQPDVIVKGREWEKVDNPEAEIVRQYAGKLLFGSGELTSTVYLSKQDEASSLSETINGSVSEFVKRHQISLERLTVLIEQFSARKVAVVGDLIIDEYIACEAVGMSREDPTIVVRPLSKELYVGGAGIVAAHATSLGAEVDFYSVTGEGGQADQCMAALKLEKLTSHLLKDRTRPVTTKTRYRAAGKTMLRVNDFRQHDVSPELIEAMMLKLETSIQNLDLLVFSDFNYGVLCPAFVEQVIALCKAHNVPMIADSQSSSQVGDLAKFKGMTLITPTEYEARLTLQDSKDGLINVSESLGRLLDSQHVFVTLGQDGVLLRTRQQDKWLTDKLPAINHNPKDVAGAGDAMMIAAALSLVSGSSIWEACLIGSLASAVQVSKLGNIPLKAEEIRQLVNKIRL